MPWPNRDSDNFLRSWNFRFKKIPENFSVHIIQLTVTQQAPCCSPESQSNSGPGVGSSIYRAWVGIRSPKLCNLEVGQQKNEVSASLIRTGHSHSVSVILHQDADKFLNKYYSQLRMVWATAVNPFNARCSKLLLFERVHRHTGLTHHF